MQIAKVVGVVVSSVKESRLEGSKLLLVNKVDPKGNVVGSPIVALDLVGAGEQEMVILVEGSSARVAAGNPNVPIDVAIVGILDSVRYNGKLVFKKS